MRESARYCIHRAVDAVQGLSTVLRTSRFMHGITLSSHGILHASQVD